MIRYRKLIVLVGLVFSVILIVAAAWHSLTFHLVKIEPADGSQPNQYTVVSFTFNKSIELQGNGLNQITITPNVKGKTIISEKAVTFLPDSFYRTDTVYSAVLSKVKSKDGKTLSNIKTTFSPQHLDFANLPKDVQKRLVEQTDTTDRTKPLYSAGDIAIDGANDLNDHGLTSQQIDALQIAFYNFFISKKEQVRGIGLSNITKQPRDPNNTSAVDTLTFTATLDNHNVYRATLEYPDLVSIRLVLNNIGNGFLVFDSGLIQ